MKLETNNFLMVDKNLIANLGLQTATVLSHLISLSDMLGDRFYQQENRLWKALNISRYNLEKEISRLQTLGLISVEKHHLNYYTLNAELINYLIKKVDTDFKDRVTGLPKSKERSSKGVTRTDEDRVKGLLDLGNPVTRLDTSDPRSEPLKENKIDPLDTSNTHDVQDKLYEQYLEEQEISKWIQTTDFGPICSPPPRQVVSDERSLDTASSEVNIQDIISQEFFSTKTSKMDIHSINVLDAAIVKKQEKDTTKEFVEDDNYLAMLDKIANGDIPPQEQALSKQQAAVMSSEYLELIRKAELDITSNESVEQTSIPNKDITSNESVEQTRKPKYPQWSIFDNWITSVWIPYYPKRVPINRVYNSLKEFRSSRLDWTEQQVQDLITTITAHTAMYMKSVDFKFLVSPDNYINSQKWLEKINTKYDPSSSLTQDGKPKFKPGLNKGWD